MQPRSLGRLLRWGLSLGLLGLSVVVAAQITDWTAFVEVLGRTAYEWLWVFLPVILGAHLLRAWRWQLLVRAALGRLPGLGNAFSAVMVGYAVNSIVPRAGELVRPYVLSRREGLSLATLLSTVAVERLLDVATLALLLLVASTLFAERLTSIVERSGGVSSVLVSLGVLALVVAALVSIRRWGGWLLRWMHTRLPSTVQRGSKLLQELAAGVAVLRQPRLYVPLLLQTLLLWFSYWAPLYGLFWVCSLPLGPAEAFQVLVVSAVAISIAPTPSAAGVYHVAVQLALVELFAIPPAEALAYAVIAHGLNTAVALVVGGLCWLWEQLRPVGAKLATGPD
ncbi:MAG: lysylphosphatidylglycerol synthase transmembrane domain-containing protein [Chlorobiota bacterium]